MKRTVHRALRAIGWQVQRWRDPYVEMVNRIGPGNVHVAIDGGAYRGTSTEKLLELCPGCVVHAFEPQRASFAELQQRLGNKTNVRLFNQALSYEPGESVLKVNAKAFTSSLMTTKLPEQMQPAGEERVTITTIDQWSQEMNAVPEVVKLDLQGAELLALQGAVNTLRRGVLAVLVEVNFELRYQDACLYHDVAGFLAGYDFDLHRMYEIVARRDGRWVHADALFLRR